MCVHMAGQTCMHTHTPHILFKMLAHSLTCVCGVSAILLHHLQPPSRTVQTLHICTSLHVLDTYTHAHKTVTVYVHVHCVCVCSGSMLEWRRLHHSSLVPHSPLLPTRKSSTDHKHVVESVVLIPALTVKAHYQSIVGPSYSNLSASKPSQGPSTSPKHTAAEARHTASVAPPPQLPSASGGSQVLPVKQGILSLSAVVESLPEHIKLTPSLLEFIEQVAQPTLAAAAVSSSSSTESISNMAAEVEVGGERGGAVRTTSPISFPVDVTLTFYIQPSTVYLTCQPHSQVECSIQSPNVNLVISFSLFSRQMCDGPPGQDSSSPTASLTGSNTSRVVPFNKLYVTGCLSTFALQLYILKHGSTSASANREALSLTLGHALFHLSRNSVSVSTCTTHNKLQVSGASMHACTAYKSSMHVHQLHAHACQLHAHARQLHILAHACQLHAHSRQLHTCTSATCTPATYMHISYMHMHASYSTCMYVCTTLTKKHWIHQDCSRTTRT